jgi:hypothetical protein
MERNDGQTGHTTARVSDGGRRCYERGRCGRGALAERAGFDPDRQCAEGIGGQAHAGAFSVAKRRADRAGALTCYEKRLSESIGETGRKAESPTPQQAWDNRAPTAPMRVGWLQPDDISPVAVFLASDAAALVTGAEYEVTAGDSAKDI